jgi:hypothetical protein
MTKNTASAESSRAEVRMKKFTSSINVIKLFSLSLKLLTNKLKRLSLVNLL